MPESGGTGGVLGSGGELGLAGAGSTDTGGMGGAPAGEIGPNCESPKRDVIVERVQAAVSGLCLAPGVYAPIDDSRLYLTTVTQCEESLSLSWTIKTLGDGVTTPYALEFRNEDLNLNLDAYLASPTEGTPMVLFSPHRLYNQRFTALDRGDGTFKLSPLHAPTQCVTESADTLVLTPCTPYLDGQSFRRIGCR